jgi:P4 family phage/plasmid primase-like protien
MAITPGIIRIYHNHGRQLIPIALDGEYRLKRPLHKNWNTREYAPDEVAAYANQGLNLGWRLGELDLVIDVDTRNGGAESLQYLLTEFKAHHPDIDELEDIFPTVKTGGGGWHFYTRLPHPTKVKNELARWPGIEFKGHGRQVIIPGSMHPSGNPYFFDELSPFEDAAPEIPTWFLKLIERDSTNTPAEKFPAGFMSVDELRRLLSHLPIEEYSSNETWFPILAAAHEATAGAGLPAFLEWSLSDNTFIGHDAIIQMRWRSFRPGAAGNITVNTLFKEVVKHGGQLPPMTLNPGEFGELPPPVPVPTPDIIKHGDIKEVERMVAALGVLSTATDIKNVLLKIIRFDVLDQELFLRAIQDKTGRTITVLKKSLGKIRAANNNDGHTDIDDQALEITTYLLQQKFQGGSHLIHGKDQRFWAYEKTHWVPVEANMIENLLLKASYQYRQKHPNLSTPIASLIGQCEKILRARRATENNLNESLLGRPPVVNTLNCEVWIDPNSGKIVTREHTPDSWLTNCLEVNFNPRATCPIFSTALEQIFSRNKDRDEIIRHLWEVIGYTIQPQKDLATWVLFHGEGANGKTVVLNVLTKLLGRAALNKSIDELDVKKNNHALADLPNRLAVIDEDLDSRTILPDATLKKISESKMLTANPKNRGTFEFMNTAIILFASNEFPKVKDLSHGLRRRALVFNFNRTFHPHEQDLTLSRRIMETEMDGVLVEALKGFRRLRARGGWKVPASCQAAQSSWFKESNTVMEFVEDTMVSAPGATIELASLFSNYRLWCSDNGHKHGYTKSNFKRALEASGVSVIRGTGNRTIIRDFHLRSNTIDLSPKGNKK